MKLLAASVAAAAVVAGSASAAGDIYRPKEYVARYCSPTGDICLGIFRSRGFVFQLMTMERYFAHYTLCVRSPRGARKCKTLPVNRQGRVWGSHRRWPRHFGDDRPGVYRVTWLHAGRALGPALRFTHR